METKIVEDSPVLIKAPFFCAEIGVHFVNKVLTKCQMICAGWDEMSWDGIRSGPGTALRLQSKIGWALCSCSLCEKSFQLNSVWTTQKINWYFTVKKKEPDKQSDLTERRKHTTSTSGCVVARQQAQFSQAQGYCSIMGLFLLVTSDCFYTLGVETMKTYEYFFKGTYLSQFWITAIYF